MRATFVKSARKAQSNCGKCGNAINVGDSYRWAKAFRGPKLVRCINCRFSAADLEPNAKRAIVVGAQEEAEAALAELSSTCTDVDAAACLEEMVTDVMSNFASQIREAAEEWEASADSIEDGFGHETEQSTEMRDLASEVESWADDAESWSSPNGDFDESEHAPEDVTDALETWADEVTSSALEIINDTRI